MSIPIFQFIPSPVPPWYPYVCSLLLCLYFCFANWSICTIFFWIPHVCINRAFWTLGLCKNLRQLLSQGLCTYCSLGLLLFLHSVQLICPPPATFIVTLSKRPSFTSSPIATLSVSTKWCPPWKHGSVVCKGTRRPAAGLLHWKVPVTLGNLCNCPLLWKLSGKLPTVFCKEDSLYF